MPDSDNMFENDEVWEFDVSSGIGSREGGGVLFGWTTANSDGVDPSLEDHSLEEISSGAEDVGDSFEAIGTSFNISVKEFKSIPICNRCGDAQESVNDSDNRLCDKCNKQKHVLRQARRFAKEKNRKNSVDPESYSSYNEEMSRRWSEKLNEEVYCFAEDGQMAVVRWVESGGVWANEENVRDIS